MARKIGCCVEDFVALGGKLRCEQRFAIPALRADGENVEDMLQLSDDPGSCHASPGLTLDVNARNRKQIHLGQNFQSIC
jgi:hypothetical protein